MAPLKNITLLAAGLLLISENISPQDNGDVVPDGSVSTDTVISDSAAVQSSMQAVGKKRPERSVQEEADDSLSDENRALRDSLILINNLSNEIYTNYPTNFDSVYNEKFVFPVQIYGSDASGFSEIMRFHPQFVTTPFSLISQMNRTLFYGFPAGHVSMTGDAGTAGRCPDAFLGTDIISAAEITNAEINLPGNCIYTRQPSRLTSPETVILWENGVFDENSLNLRFARPISRKIQFGIFSDYRDMSRKEFSHSRGGIYGMYKSIYEKAGLDTSYISHTGTNPLTREHTASARIAWNIINDTKLRFSYKYLDLHNDLAFEGRLEDSSNDTLLWELLSQYSHNIETNLRNCKIGPVDIKGDLFFSKDLARTSPLIIDTRPNQRGEKLYYGFGVSPSLPIGRDTVSISQLTSRDWKSRFDESHCTVHRNRTTIHYKHNYNLGILNGALSGMTGYDFINLNGRLEDSLVWKIDLTANIGGQELFLFALSDFLPPYIPFDTSFQVTYGSFMDRYQSYGAECRLSYHKLGLLLGYCAMRNISEESTGYLWPNGIPPYPEPNWTICVAPLFGRWHGLALSSRWLFSDRMPYVKGRTLFSFQSSLKERRPRLFLDLAFEYWSIRNAVDFAGIDTWNRSIMDLYLKMAVQIKTFRLFYKIDNIFNRKMAFIPGYYMPGLTFRWGFNWAIKG